MTVENIHTVCPGCGLSRKRQSTTTSEDPNASPECWQRYLDVAGFESSNLLRLGQYHQLLVDAYGAQHPGPPSRPIRLVYSLVGLHLALERDLPGGLVRRVHQLTGKPRPDWPCFEKPSSVGTATIDGVAAAGVDVNSVEGHATAIQAWARDVWEAWRHEHQKVHGFSERFLNRL